MDATTIDARVDATRMPWQVRGELLIRDTGTHVQEVPHHGTGRREDFHPAVRAAAAIGVTHRRMAEVVAAALAGCDRWMVHRENPDWSEVVATLRHSIDPLRTLPGVLDEAIAYYEREQAIPKNGVVDLTPYPS